MDTLSQIYDILQNGIKFEKANTAKIDFVNAMLKNNNLATIPEEYQKFLMETNGAILPPYEFYGTDIMDRKGYNYKFPNLIEANMPLIKNKNPLIEGRVIIGSVFFDVIIFDEIDKKFKIVNRINFEIIKTFEKFKHLLEYVKETI